MLTLFGTHWGIFGECGMFLAGHTYDVGVMVIFLFEMVFMDTALTIVTGACAERWKFLAFAVSSVLMGAFTYPLYGNWAWGGGWLSQLGTNLGLGKGYCDFAGSGVVHAVGGLTALAVAMIIGPRIGKFNRDGSSNAIIGHDISAVLIGCFILAFGWFGFNPGSTLGASAAGNLRIGSIAVNTMLAGCTGNIRRAALHVGAEGQARRLDERQRPAGRPGGHHRSQRIRQHPWRSHHRLHRRRAGLPQRRLCRELPQGRRSGRRHLGPRNLRTVGRALGGSVCRRHQQLRRRWNGVTGSVTGLFYGDASQLVAQIVGIATLVGFVFTFSFVLNWILDIILGQRVSIETEVAGLDLPEMGQLGYPEFVFRPEPDFMRLPNKPSHSLMKNILLVQQGQICQALLHPFSLAAIR